MAQQQQPLNQHDFNAEQFLADVPQRPGVYMFRDAEDEVLYIGKAKHLKKRLSSYFRKGALPERTLLMVSKIADAETHLTRSEAEALLLESSLIKKHKPRYNVLLKDDKSYPYIRLHTDTRAPWLQLYRGSKSRSGRYFGPYPNAGAVREMLNTLIRLFKLRQCTETVFLHRSRPCLQYQIKRCSAPCVGRISTEQYAEDVEQAIAYIEGRDETLTEALADQMQAASDALNFELAANYRDRIAAIKKIQASQYVDNERGNADVIAVSISGSLAVFYLTQIRHGRHLGGRVFVEKNPLNYNEAELLRAFVPQYYLDKSVPDEVLLSAPLPEQALIEQTLNEAANAHVAIKHQCRGIRLRWIQSAKINADDALRQRLAKHSSLDAQYSALAEALDLDEPPARMECFDISHTGGERTVASCVTFTADGADKSAYRRFNISGIEAGDDYAAMKQVLTRRYQRLLQSDAPLPELVIVDGGKGQLSQAREVLAELQLDLPLLGISKGPQRKAGEEQLHFNSKTFSLPAHSPALHLLQQIRDEAHRFAITAHRKQRGKKVSQSPLEAIEGVGEKRRATLLKYFGGLQAIQLAAVEDLAKAPGISHALAEKIYDALH